MRVGIVTFHCSYNFGSALQAWALKRVLEDAGHQVSVVDYRSRDFDQYRLLRTDSLKSLLSSVLFFPGNLRRRPSFEQFISSNLNLTERYDANDEERMARELPKQFDCFVCGSDQIWNLDCTRGPVAPFFLSFAGDARRVAYAASLSHTSFEDRYFGPKEKALIAEWLKPFSLVSVREASTASIYQTLCQQHIETCLDPTLLLDASDYGEIVVPNPDGRGTLFVYMLERNNELVRYASALAKRMSLPVSYVSKIPLNFGVPARNYYGIGPSEFLGLIQECSAVVTNSFHATVFSLLFGTPFQTFATEKSGSRMRDFLSELGEEDHLVNGSFLQEPRVADTVESAARLERLRTHSRSFLSRALA